MLGVIGVIIIFVGVCGIVSSFGPQRQPDWPEWTR